jgi:hypothetical protein
MPFGVGPRNCIGMRFALEEAKLALANLLLKFKMCRCSQTDVSVQQFNNNQYNTGNTAGLLFGLLSPPHQADGECIRFIQVPVKLLPNNFMLQPLNVKVAFEPREPK